MVLARVANFFSTGSTEQAPEFSDNARQQRTSEMHDKEGVRGDLGQEEDLEAKRPPYIHAMLAGGLGGTTGDMMMHSLDTVKTRQQGDPHMPPKYTSLGSTYRTIWRQEGFGRGLYGGVLPAFLGSFSGTMIFFGTYEWSKRFMVDFGIMPSVSYFVAGLLADFAAAPLYVPSEVLKTRLQLQGRHNNPYFESGYNYRGSTDALRTIIRQEGWSALFHGFSATLWRDLPFSALQFAFYEQEQKAARSWMGSRDIGLPLEILTGMSAGGMAGVMTCPLDVVKTRVQTQISEPAAKSSDRQSKAPLSFSKPNFPNPHSSTKHTSTPSPKTSTSSSFKNSISTSSPSTSLHNHSAATLDTTSVFTGLRIIYRTEGIAGCFRGVGPRGVWTSIQSGTMLVLYQTILKYFDENPLVGDNEPGTYA